MSAILRRWFRIRQGGSADVGTIAPVPQDNLVETTSGVSLVETTSLDQLVET